MIYIKLQKLTNKWFPLSIASFEKMYFSPFTIKYGVLSCAESNISVKYPNEFLSYKNI